MVMNVVQVVEHHEQTGSWIAVAQSAKGVAKFDHALAGAEHAAEAVGVDIVKAQELLGAVLAMVGGSHPAGTALAGPYGAGDGSQLERAPLVEAHYRRARRALAVEPADNFFSCRSRGRWRF